MRKACASPAVLFLGIVLAGISPLSAGETPEVLYAGTSVGSANPGTGLFGTVDQATGAFTPAPNDPTGEGMMPALACDAQGAVYGMENVAPQSPLTPTSGSRCGSLIQIDPTDGSLLQTFGTVEVAGLTNTCTRITDMTFQPISGTLFGLTGPGNELVTITLTTPPVATVVNPLPTLSGSEPLNRGGLAFRPSDGALFVASNDSELALIDPSDASLVSEVTQSMSDCIEGLDFRPSDGLAFAVACDSAPIYTLDVSNGTLTTLNADPTGTSENLASLAFCGPVEGTGPTPTPTATPSITATATPTSTPAATATATPPGDRQVPALEIPTLSARGVALLTLLLLAAALLVMARQRF